MRFVLAERHHGDQGEQPDPGADERRDEKTDEGSEFSGVGRRGRAEEHGAVRVGLLSQVVVQTDDESAKEPARKERHEEQERPLQASWSSPTRKPAPGSASGRS